MYNVLKQGGSLEELIVLPFQLFNLCLLNGHTLLTWLLSQNDVVTSF